MSGVPPGEKQQAVDFPRDSPGDPLDRLQRFRALLGGGVGARRLLRLAHENRGRRLQLVRRVRDEALLRAEGERRAARAGS